MVRFSKTILLLSVSVAFSLPYPSRDYVSLQRRVAAPARLEPRFWDTLREHVSALAPDLTQLAGSWIDNNAKKAEKQPDPHPHDPSPPEKPPQGHAPSHETLTPAPPSGDKSSPPDAKDQGSKPARLSKSEKKAAKQATKDAAKASKANNKALSDALPFAPDTGNGNGQSKRKQKAAAAQNKQHGDALPFAPETETKPKGSTGAFKEPPNTPFDPKSVKNLQIPAFNPNKAAAKSSAGAFKEPPNTPFDPKSVKNLQIPAFNPNKAPTAAKSSAGAFKEPPNTRFDPKSVQNLQIPAFKPKPPTPASPPKADPNAKNKKTKESPVRRRELSERSLLYGKGVVFAREVDY